MNKGRLEAFSDGVFAITITLLVLSIRIPGTEVASDKALQTALKDAWPNLLTFLFSFLVVGIFWGGADPVPRGGARDAPAFPHGHHLLLRGPFPLRCPALPAA
ncbi:MAG TPA: TMEM175 family protein [Dinghuibacter sp.]|uniref:TMEM175 family protein n=1 Tax=Dinghuibacter sp. TaxID=2024697 RepID=UPI002BCC7637|nr:TMEM175 family protein [Dinghuibacter sp.]HTJ10517.1 TMEM175 family protein [Dinghuibacter sp.]